ncbi:MAG: DNA/RNA non-specific endonuclease [Rikenellaceae bacterium]
MFISTKLKCRLFSTMMLFAAVVSTSCTYAPDEVASDLVSIALESIELTNGSGSSKVVYTAAVGTEWSAEITEGGDFLSFSINSTVAEIGGDVLSAGNNALYFYFSSNNTGEDRTANIRFEIAGSVPVDLSVRQLSASSVNYPYSNGDVPRWYEIPTKIESDSYLYVTHRAALDDEYSTKVRNFSLCFDVDNYAALWVAYPYHDIYDGDSGRIESWAYDPLIPTAYQANLSGSYGNSGGNSYDRGHQIASNDRQGSAEMNEQTFYFSNMTPQLGSLNQQKWATLETTVRKQVCSDTLYVVTGAYYKSILGYSTDSSGKYCPIPSAYYKVLVRTRYGNTGKTISECSDSDLQAIGYWAENKFYSTNIEPVSVASIEELTGFNFFPDVSATVKATYNEIDWL